jgi:hypothetical protein
MRVYAGNRPKKTSATKAGRAGKRQRVGPKTSSKTQHRGRRVVRDRGASMVASRARDAYLALLADPLLAEPTQVPDGYHADSSPIKLVQAGINMPIDNLGNGYGMIDMHGFGTNGSTMGCWTTAAATKVGAGANSAISTLSSGNNFIWFSPPSNYRQTTNWKSIANDSAVGGAAAPGDVMTFSGGGDWEGATGNGPAQRLQTADPIAFTGNPQLLNFFSHARFVAGGVQFKYTGPHGDSQKGLIYVNTSQIGLPDNGVTHFPSLAALVSHPDTVCFPLGTSFVVPLYPASVVGDGFVNLNAVVPACNPNTSRANLAFSWTDGTAATRTATTTMIRPGGSQDLSAVGSRQIDVLYAAGSVTTNTVLSIAGIPMATNADGITYTVLDGSFTAENHDVQDRTTSVSSGVLGQLPVLYYYVVGANPSTPTVASPVYTMKVVTNLECIARPSVAQFISGESIPARPGAVKQGSKFMAIAGDLTKLFASKALEVVAPYASDLGTSLGGAATGVLRNFMA